MKELDKAIINGDVKHIVFLIKDNHINCQGAVLMHLKEKLVPAHFTEQALQEKGVILSLDDLEAAMAGYMAKSTYDYASEAYVKRLYLGLQQAFLAWQRGTLANKALADTWNQQAIAHLTSVWMKGNLPDSLQAYANEKQQAYVLAKFQQWQAQSLEPTEMRELDTILQQALNRHWFNTMQSKDEVAQQIESNILDQTVEYYRYAQELPEFVEEIKALINQRIHHQINDGSINEEAIRYLIEEEKECLLQGKVTPHIMPYYKKAVENLLTKWQTGHLDSVISDDVTGYVKKQLKTYELPGKLKALLVEKAIQQLLAQYKALQWGETSLSHQNQNDKGYHTVKNIDSNNNNQSNRLVKFANEAALLDEMTANHLYQQFEGNITGYYEKQAMKETAFRDELANKIFSNLLQDWNQQSLTPADSDYLQRTLLPPVQSLLSDLSKYTSRAALFLEMQQMQEMIKQLREEVNELKKAKPPQVDLPSAQVVENTNREAVNTLKKIGIFPHAINQDEEHGNSEEKQPSANNNPNFKPS